MSQDENKTIGNAFQNVFSKEEHLTFLNQTQFASFRYHLAFKYTRSYDNVAHH